MSAHPADSAQPGDAFHDEKGVTWMKIDASDVSPPWLMSRRVNGTRWNTTAEARERTLTPLVPVVELTEQLDVPLTPDPSNPAQLRLVVALLDELRASDEMDGYQGSLAVIARELSIRADHLDADADRLEADAADRALAEKIAREAVPPNAWVQFDRLDGVVRESRIQTALAGIRAGRDAERGA